MRKQIALKALLCLTSVFLAAFLLQSCSKDNNETNPPPVKIDDADRLKALEHVFVENNQYVLNLSQTEAEKQGISNNSYKAICNYIAETNSKIRKLESDNGGNVIIYNPQDNLIQSTKACGDWDGCHGPGVACPLNCKMEGCKNCTPPNPEGPGTNPNLKPDIQFEQFLSNSSGFTTVGPFGGSSTCDYDEMEIIAHLPSYGNLTVRFSLWICSEYECYYPINLYMQQFQFSATYYFDFWYTGSNTKLLERFNIKPHGFLCSERIDYMIWAEYTLQTTASAGGYVYFNVKDKY